MSEVKSQISVVPRSFDLGAGAMLFCVAFTCFVSTLAPGVLGGDAGELQFVPKILSLAHPTGYPLQTLLDHLWIQIFPFGTVAWRTNLLSALVSAAGVTLVWATVERSTGNRWAGYVAAVALLTSPIYWGQAVLGDKYALNGCLTALLLFASWRFWHKPSPGRLASLVFVAGMALAQHRSFLAFGPPLAALLITKLWRMPRRKTTLLAATAAFMTPLMFYSYLPWASLRNLPPYPPKITDIAGFIRFMEDTGFIAQIGWVPKIENAQYYIGTLVTNFGVILLLTAAAGLFALIIRSHRLGWLLFLGANFVLQSYMAQNYEVPRRYVFFIPAFMCAGMLIGEGIAGLAELARSLAIKPNPRKANFATACVAVVALVLLLADLPAEWRLHWAEQRVEIPLDIWRQDLKSGGQADRMAISLLGVPAHSVIVGDWEQATALWYAQTVNGWCSDCLIRSPLEDLGKFTGWARNEGWELYVSRTLNQASDWSDPTSVGALVHLASGPDTVLPANLNTLGLNFEGDVQLVGFTWPLGQPIFEPGRVVPISLVWQGVNGQSPDYALSLRLVGNNGDVWKEDVSAPVLGMHPFSRLEPRQVISDYHEIPLPQHLSPGRYAVNVILYRVSSDGSFSNAQVTSPGEASHLDEATVVAFEVH